MFLSKNSADQKLDLCSQNYASRLAAANFNCNNGDGMSRSPPELKKSISFFSSDDLFSFRTIPILGAASYLASSVGAVAMDETFVQ